MAYWSYAVTKMTTGACEGSISSRTSKPSSLGIWTSRKSRSGMVSAIAFTASNPLAHSAATTISGCVANNSRRYPRASSSSSTRTALNVCFITFSGTIRGLRRPRLAFGLEAGGPNFGNYAGSSSSKDQSLALGWTYTISPTVVNEFRLGYMRYGVNDVPNGYGTKPAAAAGIPGLNLDKTYTSGMPYFNIGNPIGSEQLGYALGVNQCNCPLTQSERQIQFVDNLTKIKGNHSIKFGADLRYAMNLRVPSDSHRAGSCTFSGSDTANVTPTAEVGGLGLASFLLGDVSSFQRYVSTSTDAQERQKRFFWYGQDEWRVSPKLTVTLGIRWEMVFPESVNAAGNGATLELTNGLMYVFGVGGVSSHGIQNMDWHSFAPRAGIAYQVTVS